MIVVLPFENLGEPEDKYFADGMTEEITSRLAALNGLGVISRTSALQYAENRPGSGDRSAKSSASATSWRVPCAGSGRTTVPARSGSLHS